jgi:hypothetical protein
MDVVPVKPVDMNNKEKDNGEVENGDDKDGDKNTKEGEKDSNDFHGMDIKIITIHNIII